jgi:hypothetical protein
MAKTYPHWRKLGMTEHRVAVTFGRTLFGDEGEG